MPNLSQYEIRQFNQFHWYPNVVEEFSPNAPVLKGKPVGVNSFFYASHASYLVTRRPVTGILLFITNTSIEWYSKWQGTVERATYGS